MICFLCNVSILRLKFQKVDKGQGHEGSVFPNFKNYLRQIETSHRKIAFTIS